MRKIFYSLLLIYFCLSFTVIIRAEKIYVVDNIEYEDTVEEYKYNKIGFVTNIQNDIGANIKRKIKLKYKNNNLKSVKDI